MSRALESIYVFGTVMGLGIAATGIMLLATALLPLVTISVACKASIQVLGDKEVAL